MTERLMQNFKRFLHDEEGQSTTEYILILAVVVMIALKFKKQVGSLIDDRIDKLSGEIQQFDQIN